MKVAEGPARRSATMRASSMSSIVRPPASPRITGTAGGPSPRIDTPGVTAIASATCAGLRCSSSSVPMITGAAAGVPSMFGATPVVTVTVSRYAASIRSSDASDCR
jgi:hypothetical protein